MIFFIVSATVCVHHIHLRHLRSSAFCALYVLFVANPTLQKGNSYSIKLTPFGRTFSDFHIHR